MDPIISPIPRRPLRRQALSHWKGVRAKCCGCLSLNKQYLFYLIPAQNLITPRTLIEPSQTVILAKITGMNLDTCNPHDIEPFNTFFDLVRNPKRT